MSQIHGSFRMGGVGFLVSIALGVSSFMMPPSTEAAIITVDPSNYAEGTDLSNISPFVTLRGLDGSFGSAPIVAKRSGFNGSLGFGTFELGWVQCVGQYDCAQGFGMAFHQSPEWVSLSITFTDLVLSDLSSLGWFAFDAAGNLLATGFTDTYGYQPGQFFAWNIAVPDMRSLVVGGGDYPSAGNFDRLSFAVGVPEPSGLVLSALGLAGVFLRRWWKRPETSAPNDLSN